MTNSHSDSAGSSPRLVAKDISKHFGAVRALRAVSFSLQPGEVHALLGENGAGKSTLGKICSGVYQRDSGTILLDGVAVDVPDEAAAGRLGIGIVHQEGSLTPGLRVAENIYAGRQPTTFFGQVDQRAMRDGAAKLLDQLGSRIDPMARVSSLSPAQRQIVEIAKALSQNLRVLILDEPTAALTVAETEGLFAVVRRLAAQQVSVIYVSHRLAEIFALCDRVTVLKDGAFAGTAIVAQTTPEELVRLMVGRDVSFRREPVHHQIGQVVLEARNVSDGRAVVDASLELRAGELVCLAGLIGSGRTELCETIFGARELKRGSIHLEGRLHRPRGPWDGIAAGIGMACEDRKESGLFLNMDITRNIAVAVPGKVSRAGHISSAASRELAQDYVKRLSIATPSIDQKVGNLSGGNQQKVLLAKWLALRPRVLIIDEPTRGVDVGARTEIYRILRSLAADGVALLVVSSDLPEVLTLADRIVVMAEGRTVGELAGAEASEESVMALAAVHTQRLAG